MANFKNILWFCVVCLVNGLSLADKTTQSPYVKLAAPKPSATKFEPLLMKFPDTSRTPAQAEKYKEEVMNGLPTRAKKEDAHLKMTGQSCARGLGDLYKVFDDDNKLLYEICFDDARASAIYTTHVVDLADKDLERSSHLSFKSLYTLYGQKVDEKYKAAVQTKQFNERFGSGSNIAEEETKKMNYFSRNHLTPHADFTKKSQQEQTYYFQNCVPGKQSMNQGNWSTLEDLVRAISRQMGYVLRVFTGAYGILMKTDKDGKYTEVYLDDPVDSDKKKIEVPLVVWKLVIDTKTNDSVAFFTSNDTDMDEKQVKMYKTLCNSVCHELGYNFKEDPKSGISLCCRYDDFAKHIKYLPIQLNKSNLLKNTVRLEKMNAKGTKSPRGSA